jgi:hypothetical protein
VNGAAPPFTKITPAERRRSELSADEGRLQDGDLIFSNILSYTLPGGDASATNDQATARHEGIMPTGPVPAAAAPLKITSGYG